MASKIDLQKIMRERGQIRGAFTRYAAQVEDKLKEKSYTDFNSDYEYLAEKFQQVTNFDKIIHESYLNADEESYDESALEKEVEKCEEYRIRWYRIKSDLSKFKDREADGPTKKPDQAQAPQQSNMTLPKLEIRKFDDNPKNWIAFWAQFKKIHTRESLDEEDKFQYLIQSMEKGSSARSLVESYPPSRENYHKVVESLKNRFAKDEVLIETYVRELLKLVLVKNSLTIDGLYDKIVANVQTLETLGVTREKYECILFPLIESCLPDKTLLTWSRITLNDESKLSQLLKFLQNEVEAEERIRLAQQDFTSKEKETEKEEKNPTATAACLVNSEVKKNINTDGKLISCLFCDKMHNTVECSKNSSLSLEEKKDLIKKKGGCYICLRRGHLAKNCKTFIKCLCCNKRHIVVVCPNLHGSQQRSLPHKTESTEISNNFLKHNNATLLQTVIVKITHNHEEKKVRALLDSGSQRTYIKASLTEELKLEVTGTENLGHSLFGGVKRKVQTHRLIKFQVSNLDNTYQTTMTGLESDVLCGYLPKVNDPSLIQKLKNRKIHLTDCDEDISEISVLIGSDYIGAILDTGMVHLTDNLVVLKTKLGWTIQGPAQGVYTMMVISLFSSPILQDNLEFMWNIETLGIKDPYEKENNMTEMEMLNYFNDNISNKDGRYQVNLIWKAERTPLESGYAQAERRLMSTTRRLEHTGNMKAYHKVFQEWEEEGIIKKVEVNNRDEGHYLPHHPVIKMESKSTKIRPVFDASAKDGNGNSLNACIEKFPNMIEDIPKLLIQFRMKAYGTSITSDIRRAFLQIYVAPADQKYLKLLWWSDPAKKDKILTYQHTRVPFGVACSPFLLAATINYHLNKIKNDYPETTKKLRDSFYVDNCVTSCDTENHAQRFREEATEIMNRGKFELRDWITNSSEHKGSVSVLGIQWNIREDKLYCNLNLKAIPNEISKRDLLSITQQIFDPLGFLCPVTLIPKLIIQRAWMLQTGWDEKIPTELEKEYKNWLSSIDNINRCKVPRRLSDAPLQDCEITVHVFCDASKTAYAGCIFLRSEFRDQVSVRLIMAKSRVAPIKREMTLPRLELMGAVIAARLYNQVVTSGLLENCKNHKLYCWTDSAVVFAWLKRQNCWKTFVNNRVAEICKITNRDDWYHLPGSCNPADLPSRGCSATSLLKCHWWTGPEWLYLEKENWPQSNLSTIRFEEDEIMKEQNKYIAVNMDISSDKFSRKLLYFRKYSKIVRVVARILRLNPKIRKQYNVNSDHIGNEEYRNAEEILIRLIQKEYYEDNEDKQNKLPTMKENDIIRIKTRLELSHEKKNFIYPILLPGKDEIVRRMVEQTHVRLCHAGTQVLMTCLRENYWITGIRKLAKQIVSQCIICMRYKAKHYEAPQPPLPMDRVRNSPPFEVTGIDLAGPLFLKDNSKCWIVLFTCAVYRAVHLELTNSLSTAGFLMTLRRFIARRGRVRIIYSDNGTNFQGTANLLKEVDWTKIESATNPVIWKFSPPAAPWWGGWWERLIRVVKEMLRRILGKACVDYIELSTILCDCEAVINNRPLTYVDMGELKPLTPMMFLQSLSESDTPDLDQIDQKGLNVRYRYLQELRENFRKRFKNEYLALLINKGKDKNSREPKVGEEVLIETDSKRLNWPLGVIKEVFVGKDGFTRVARIQTSAGEKVRPYQRLYPLEIETNSMDWLDQIPGKTNFNDLESASVTSDSIETEPLASTSRSGRKIKLPSRYLT